MSDAHNRDELNIEDVAPARSVLTGPISGAGYKAT